MKYVLTAALCLATTAAIAQENDPWAFEEGSEARSWNLYAEIPATFEATVVDLLCEVAGNCVDNCGDGKRQLGLLRTADSALIYPNKNNQTSFNGAVADLLPYCGQTVEVDGLILDDPDLGATNIYQLQTIRLAGETEWTKANQWTKAWEAANPGAEGKGPWFRRDPRVLAEIAEEGYFGLGLEQDEVIKDAIFE